jgi:hypothetical protein
LDTENRNTLIRALAAQIFLNEFKRSIDKVPLSAVKIHQECLEDKMSKDIQRTAGVWIQVVGF